MPTMCMRDVNGEYPFQWFAKNSLASHGESGGTPASFVSMVLNGKLPEATYGRRLTIFSIRGGFPPPYFFPHRKC